MKMNKLVTAGALALAFTGAASAQTVLRLSGATAYRASTHSAIQEIMTGESYGFVGSNLAGANEAIFKGTVAGVAGQVVIITKWSGSVGGVEDLAKDRIHGDAISYPGSTRWLADVAGNYPNAVIASPARDSANNMADAAMSDSYASSTGISGNALLSNPVGIVPFFWVKGSSDNTDVQAVFDKITGITAFKAQALLAGLVQGSLLTGDQADAGVFFFSVGRNSESGTRLGTFAESGYGIFTPPQQWTPTVSGGKVTAVVADTTGGGFASGSGVSGAIKVPVATTATVDFNDGSGPMSDIPFGLIGYMGLGDVNNNDLSAQVLAWNGSSVPVTVTGTKPNQVETWDFTPVYNGQYTFWTYEHILWRSTLSGTKATIANTLKNKITALVTQPAGLNLADMNVERTVEGGVITSK